MHTVAFVGCGGVAGANTTPEKAGADGYCHLAAPLGNPRIRLVAVADLSPERLALFRQNWGAAFPDTKCYSSMAAMLQETKPDVVEVLTRGPAHFPAMMEVLQFRPRLILVEKAPTCSLQEMDEILAAAKAVNVPITVSYSRHWSPVLLRMEELLRNGLIGEVKTVVGYCPGWLFSMCSHLTDLICQFAGYDPVAVTARGSVRLGDEKRGMGWHRIDNLPAGYEPEPHADVMVIEYASGIVGVQVGAPGEHGWLYCDIMGTDGCLRVHWETVPAAHEKAPKAMDMKGKPIDLAVHGLPEPRGVFRTCYEQIADYLEGGPLPACTNEKWAAVHEIGFAGVESILGGGRIAIPNAKRDRKLFML